MPEQDANGSIPAASQSTAEAVVKTEASVASSAPVPQPASNALLPDKAAQVPKFVSCMASDRRVDEAAINAVLPRKEKE